MEFHNVSVAINSNTYFELEGNWDRDIIRVRLTPKN